MTILDMSMWGGVLIAAVLLLRRCALHRLPKWTFLLLWGTALCRLLIPLSVPSPLSVCNAPAWAAAVVQRSDPAPAEGAAPSAPTGDTASPEAPVTVVPSVPRTPAEDRRPAAAPELEKTSLSPVRVIYFTGAALCALFFTAACLRCLLAFRGAEAVEGELTVRWQEAHPRVRLRRSSAVAAPLTYGLFRPVILLPQNTDWSDEEQLTCVLTHEYIHIRRGDLFWKLLLAAALCVHWFNPLVWAMYFCANRDLELACDEAAIRTLGLEHRKRYALSLLNAEASRGQFLPLCSGYGSNQTEERILAIMKLKKRSVWAALTALILVIGTVAIFATGPVPGKAQPTQRTPPPDISQLEPARPSDPVLPEQSPDPVQSEPLQPEPEPTPAEELDTQPEPTEPVPDPQSTKISAYPVNSKGHTYGKWSEADGYDDVPDLIYIRWNSETSGYLNRNEVYPYSWPLGPNSTQEELQRYVDWYHDLTKYDKENVRCGGHAASLNLYDQEENEIVGCCGGFNMDAHPGGYKLSDEALLERVSQGNPITWTLSLGTAPAETIPNRQDQPGRRPPRDEEELAYLNEWTENGDWRRNSKGQTYGPEELAYIVGYFPDLIYIRHGDVQGYITWHSYHYGNYPEPADSYVDFQDFDIWRQTRPATELVPIYDLEGTQVLGYREYVNWQEPMSADEVEEWLELIANRLREHGSSEEEIVQTIEKFRNSHDL